MTNDSGANKGVSLPFARIVLVLAALVALGAVAIAVLRSRDGVPVAPPQPGEAQAVGDVGSMIGGLEKKLAADPKDAKGWSLLGQAYYHVGRYADSVKAYSRAVGLEPGNGEAWSALGEVQVLAGPGGITSDALTSFRKALAIDPTDFRSRYFLAVQKNEDGQHAQAVDDLIAIVKDSPPDAPWLQPVRDLALRIASEQKIDITGRLPTPAPAAMQQTAPTEDMSGGGSVAAAGIPGPTSADLKAASSMTPSQQDEMARGMVARLAARLDQNPQDADGWIRLMRARVMLKDMPGAKAAMAKAKAAFPNDQAQQARFDEAAKVLGI